MVEEDKDGNTRNRGQAVMIVGHTFNRKSDSVRLWNTDINCVMVSPKVIYLKRMFHEHRYDKDHIDLGTEEMKPDNAVNDDQQRILVKITMWHHPIGSPSFLVYCSIHYNASHSTIHATPSISPMYTILLDDGITIKASFCHLAQVGHNIPANNSPGSSTFEGLPHFLQHGSKITMDHDIIFHKGCLVYSAGGFRFDILRHPRCTKVEKSLSLPDFKHNLITLVGYNVTIPGYFTFNFYIQQCTIGYLISTNNLIGLCPPSL